MRGRKGWRLLCAIIFLSTFRSEVTAKSVFAVASHGTSKVKAYMVDPADGTVDFQATIKDTEHFGNGATGLCVWPNVERLFVTYENSSKIAWASTKTLRRSMDDEIDAPESNLAGVIADQRSSVLYTIGRNTGHLFTYVFDIQNDTLVLTYPDGQSYRQLAGLSGAYGMALDENAGPLYFGIPAGLLYVADGSIIVRYYNTMTWELAGSVNVGRSAVGIDVDGNGYLYAGGYLSHNYLMRYALGGDPGDSETLIEKDMGANITDIIIDRDSGILYTTSRRMVNGRIGAVEVYDAGNWTSGDPNSIIQIDIESDSDFGGPAGIGIGSQYKPDNNMFIDKVDDVDEVTEFVLPEDVFHYSIAYHAGLVDETNVVITDKLPKGVDFVSADPNTGIYTPPPVHTYTWVIGDVPAYELNAPGDPNYYFSLTAQVNNKAEPAGYLYNRVTAESDLSYNEAEEYTPTGCFGGDIIYVNQKAAGANTGTSWLNAYTDLQSALSRAGKGCGNEIWVAYGTYNPGTVFTDSFVIPADVTLYGGFAGNETQRDQRNPALYKTTLSGLINETSKNNTVVKMGNNSILDGCTVEQSGVGQGVLGQDVDFTVANCIIENNQRYGISALYCNAVIRWCTIRNNNYDGIYHQGSYGGNHTLDVENCTIYDNQWNGIYTLYSVPYVLNSVIYNNASGGSYYGLNILNPSASPVIRNNTIVHNVNEGVRFVGGSVPDIRNCIIWQNNNSLKQLKGLDSDQVYYSCVQDCNDVNDEHNINDAPGFVYDFEPYGFYHIKYESPCRNAGDDNYVGQDEVDMDIELRIQEGTVDIGADEVGCSDTWNEKDWTFDGVINLEEYAIFSEAWLSHDPNDPAVLDPNSPANDPNDPGYVDEGDKLRWNPVCNLDATGVSTYKIDIADFVAFCGNWLWQACWRENYSVVMYGMSGGGEGMMISVPIMQPERLYEQPLQVESETVSNTKVQPLPQKTVEQQIVDLQETAQFLEKLWLEDPYIQQEIDPDSWKRFMEVVYDTLFKLKTGNSHVEW